MSERRKPPPASLRGGPAANEQPPLRMDIKFPILGFLMDGAATGYDLRRRFRQELGFFYRVSDGSLYPALKKLETGRLVTMRTERQGMRSRKVYAISAAGRQRFAKMLGEPAQPLFVFDETLVKIYFAGHDAAAALDLMRTAQRQDAARAAMIADLVELMRRRDDNFFRRVVVEIGLAVNEAKARTFARLLEGLERELRVVPAPASNRRRAVLSQAAAPREDDDGSQLRRRAAKRLPRLPAR